MWPDPIPDVVDWQPKQKVPAGRELRIQGRNLDPSRFVAKVGETALTPVSQSASEIKFTVPAWLRAFNTPLIVYHRGGTPRTLELSYEVFDPAVKITRVVPETFSLTCAASEWKQRPVGTLSAGPIAAGR